MTDLSRLPPDLPVPPDDVVKADAKLYEAQRDETSGEIQELMVQVRTQQGVLSLLRDSILPRSREAFDLARSDYAKGNVDYATVTAAIESAAKTDLDMLVKAGTITQQRENTMLDRLDQALKNGKLFGGARNKSTTPSAPTSSPSGATSSS